MKRVLISAPYMLRATEKPKVEAMLRGLPLEVTWANVHERLEEADLLKIIDQYEGVIVGDDRFTAKVYDAAKKLKVVVKWGTGIDSLNKDEAEKRGIRLSRTPGAFTEPVSDSTLALMLAFSRGLFLNDRVIKKGGWDKPQGYTLGERTIGLIGFGDIGQAVAKRLQPFGPKVLAYDILSKDADMAAKLGVALVDRARIFDECDIISLHCDLNDTSFRILNREVFSRIASQGRKPYIINTARGPLIEEKALIEALRNGSVSGAGLDVFEDEPLPVESPLRSMDQVILSSHNTNSSPKCWDRVHQNSVRMLCEGLGL